MEECAQEDNQKSMRFRYEQAVDEQKKELREYKKKLKAQETSKVELVPLVVVKDAPGLDKTSIHTPLEA